MSIWGFTILKCINPEVVCAVVKEINFISSHGRSEVYEAWWPGDTELGVETMNGVPHER